LFGEREVGMELIRKIGLKYGIWRKRGCGKGDWRKIWNVM
jgi:hypothetical protein